jgi:transcription elongation GreA/GreB family factor
MQKELIVLADDRRNAEARIAELEKAIRDLGPEFYEVFNQSSETWHDNAPFDALRDRQSVLDAELQQLRSILRNCSLTIPRIKKNTIGIGSKVTLEDGRRFLVAGDWTPRAGQTQGAYVVVSCQAALGMALLKKKVGDEVSVGRTSSVIVDVQ